MASTLLLPNPFAGPRQRARAAVRRGNRARERRDWSTAADAFAEALRHAPARTDLWVQLGHMRKEEGDFAAAERAYGRALRDTPEDGDLWLNVGHLMKLRGRQDDAAWSFAKAEALGEARPGLAEEIARLVQAGRTESALMPLDVSLATLAVIDEARRQWTKAR